MKGLRAELARVGIRGRLANRIVAELDDHLACDPDANLGAPSLIADRFAEELRVPKTRRATYLGFAGLALAAVLLGAVVRSANGSGGLVVSFAGLAVVLGAQVAFAAGVLALWGARLGTPVAVVQRRVLVALIGGVIVLASLAVVAVVLRQWIVLLALAPAPLLAASAAELQVAVGITPDRGGRSRGFASREAFLVGLAVVTVVTLGSAHAERSWFEGVSRGVVEAIAFAAGYLVLGRRLGIRR